MSKVPCGGSKLDENFLGMNENDELSLIGGSEGKAYQYLVTDDAGKTTWEDRLAYTDSRVVVDTGGIKLVMVSGEVPSWASGNVAVKCWFSKNAQTFTMQPEQFKFLGNGSFSAGFVFFITTDNFEAEGVVFPKKGVYFASSIPNLGGASVTGVASADSDTPEITWDGSINIIKKIDEKFLPDQLMLYIHPNIGENVVVKNEDASKTPEYAMPDEIQQAFLGRGVYVKSDNVYSQVVSIALEAGNLTLGNGTTVTYFDIK